MKPTNNQVPRHIGIILDGNRRFAERLMAKPWKGHEWGTQKVEKLVEWCHDFDIRELTLYSFSIQNFNRPKEEFEYLMKLFAESFMKANDDERIHKYKIRINVIGRLWLFPKEIQDMMKAIMERTKDYTDHIINFAIGYGGREEVIDAVKKIAQEVKDGKLDIDAINEESFSRNLYIDSDPDLIIRTGGENRTSNFLIWQSNYSEWIFLDKLWPEFDREDFAMCIAEYSSRKRRFGK
ncbi:MAG: di-trans,poly-cis-decaprenylcistransferase [Nanoarchaeota archaeon]|nr:di-trans,poly-cis-decaprenylcistransferase [Nanoarchaeota archaeon]